MREMLLNDEALPSVSECTDPMEYVSVKRCGASRQLSEKTPTPVFANLPPAASPVAVELIIHPYISSIHKKGDPDSGGCAYVHSLDRFAQQSLTQDLNRFCKVRSFLCLVFFTPIPIASGDAAFDVEERSRVSMRLNDSVSPSDRCGRALNPLFSRLCMYPRSACAPYLSEADPREKSCEESVGVCQAAFQSPLSLQEDFQPTVMVTFSQDLRNKVEPSYRMASDADDATTKRVGIDLMVASTQQCDLHCHSIMAAISAFGGFPGGPITPEVFELLREQQQRIQAGAMAFPDLARILLQQRFNQLAATANNLRTDSSATPRPEKAQPAAKRPYSGLSSSDSNASPETENEEQKPRKRTRVGGPSVKTAEVWRFFDQIPNEQAATCGICSKTIKATNSSTTGMIRHLRSCHAAEHEILQHARRQNFLRKGLKSGVLLDGEQLNELAMLQQMDQQQEKDAALDTETDHHSDTVESFAASTSSSSSDVDVKHNVHRRIATPKRSTLSPKIESEQDTFDFSTPVARAKRGRPPKITSDEPAPETPSNQRYTKVYHDLAVMFSCGVLPVNVMDNQLFRNFLTSCVPGMPVCSSEDFLAKVIPSFANASTNIQAFMKNNPSMKPSPIRTMKPRNGSEGKGASPAPTTESGFHEEDEAAQSADDVSIPGSFFANILNLCSGQPLIPTEDNKSSVSPAPDSVVSENSSYQSNDEFETLFNEFIDYIGQDIFPRVPLHDLLFRLYTVYSTIKDSSHLIKELFTLMDLPVDLDLDTGITRRLADDSGIDTNDLQINMSANTPQLVSCLNFASVAFSDINKLIKKDVLPIKAVFEPEDHELISAVQHQLTNP
uniref:BED-type domain-containing protein n=1 Tax=Panagrellus redivivus TaxID=6233 RepID=A0A7E4V5S9_PANRE